ncbi:MAG: hypothetical protein ABJB40_07015 [Acidobacteriota bacterium]
MKTKTLLAVIFVAALSIAGYSQSVVITGNKVTYKRPKPISEYKKTFTINYPKVKASTPALSKKIEAAISYSSVLKLDLRGELRDEQWLEEADYEVGYNKNGILSIALSMDGSAAYPDGETKNVVVDLRSGTRVWPADVFSNLPGLLALVRKAKDKEVAQAIVDIKKVPENKDIDPSDQFKEAAKYNPMKLDQFSVADDGVTFHYDYGFPHVIEALQPPGEFKFTWKQLKPYIKAGGLLTKVAR